MVKSGVTTSINTKHQCITAMKEYENKSLEVRSSGFILSSVQSDNHLFDMFNNCISVYIINFLLFLGAKVGGLPGREEGTLQPNGSQCRRPVRGCRHPDSQHCYRPLRLLGYRLQLQPAQALLQCQYVIRVQVSVYIYITLKLKCCRDLQK